MRVAVRLAPAGAATASPPSDRSGWTAVIVDVLRASTTLTVALANGARAVEAFADPAAALARRDGASDVLACGERHARLIPGFDLGNSPSEYTRERVAGRVLAFASTNGSLALLAAAACRRRLLGSFVNATAVLDAATPGPDVWIVCAGKDGALGLEDVAFAGWLAAGLERRGARLDGAAARLALSLAPRDDGDIRATVQGSAHGRTLRSLGPDYARDVEFCATRDTIDRAFEV